MSSSAADRGDDLLYQADLAVGGGPERAQVTRFDAVCRQGAGGPCPCQRPAPPRPPALTFPPPRRHDGPGCDPGGSLNAVSAFYNAQKLKDVPDGGDDPQAATRH